MSVISQALEEATRRLVKEHSLDAEKLTEGQLADAIRQALLCGDFQRWVEQSGGGQQVVYLPFSAERRRAFQVKELRGLIERIVKEVEWLQHFPDQCGERILALCKQAREIGTGAAVEG